MHLATFSATAALLFAAPSLCKVPTLRLLAPLVKYQVSNVVLETGQTSSNFSTDGSSLSRRAASQTWSNHLSFRVDMNATRSTAFCNTTFFSSSPQPMKYTDCVHPPEGDQTFKFAIDTDFSTWQPNTVAPFSLNITSAFFEEVPAAISGGPSTAWYVTALGRVDVQAADLSQAGSSSSQTSFSSSSILSSTLVGANITGYPMDQFKQDLKV